MHWMYVLIGIEMGKKRCKRSLYVKGGMEGFNG